MSKIVDPVIERIIKELEEIKHEDSEKKQKTEKFINDIKRWMNSDDPEDKKNLIVLKEQECPEYKIEMSDKGFPYLKFESEEDCKKFKKYGNIQIENGRIMIDYRRSKNETFQEIKASLFD